MAKSQDRETQEKEKDRKRKDRKALVGRVKKVVKKSRRKLGEEKFEKELQRTIAFLEQMRMALANSHDENSAAAKPPAKPKPAVTPAKPAAKKAAARPRK